MRFSVVSLAAALGLALAHPLPAQTADLDTQLVLSTVKLTNPDSTATAFVLSRPDPNEPTRPQFLLVTADHVFSRMKNDEATVVYRKRQPDGEFVKAPAVVKVRDNGRALWTKHPQADVAVLPVTPPADVAMPGIPVDRLATDGDLTRYEIHPGDILRCVGFPHANQFEVGAAAFPVVRSGCIASFPLLPTKKTKTFLMDFNTFEGDSGAAVYLTESGRFYGGEARPGRIELILGLVSGQHFLDEEFKMIYASGKFRQRMGLGIVIHASAIRETIDMLSRNP